MKKRNVKIRNMTAGALAFLLCALAVMPAFAAFDPPMPEDGSVSGGIFVPDGESELAIEQAELRFDLSDLLLEEYTSEQDFLAYNAQVTATYSLYNPTDHTVTEQLATPIGTYPWAANAIPKGADTHKYTVAVNGVQIAPQQRHVFTVGAGYYASATQYYDVHLPEFGLAYLSDSLILHPVLSPDATVYEYTYLAKVDPGAQENDFYIYADIEADPQTSALFVPWYSYAGERSGNVVTLIRNVYKSEEFSICSVGEPLDDFSWNAEYFKGDQAQASVQQISVTTMTLYEYVMQGYDVQSGVSEQDYFNAFIALAEKNRSPDTAVITLSEECPLPEYHLQTWQLFFVELAPGERTTVTVTAPLYPSLYTRYDPPIYIYAYAMTPDNAWSAYGQTRVELITENILLDRESPTPEHDQYTQTEQGYLWEGQADFPYLVFATCETRKPSDGSAFVAIILTVLLILFAFVIFVLPWVILILAIFLTVFLIVRKVKKNRKKKRAAVTPEPPEKQDKEEGNHEE